MTALIYGLLIGSFLNVCIFRLPPRFFYFDNLYAAAKMMDLLADVKELIGRITGSWARGKSPNIEIEPFLYAEPFWMVTIAPETAITAAIAHNFNLFRDTFPDPVTIVKPRSFCPNCKNMIRWWMNIPILSYVFLGGKCYFCKKKISLRYPVIEFISGVLCASLYYVYGRENIPVFLFYYTLSALCIVTFFIDLDHWLILDEITIPFTLLGIIGSIFIPVKFLKPFNLELLPYNIPDAPLPLKWYASIINAAPPWLNAESLFMSLGGAVLSLSAFFMVAVLGTVLAKREAMGGGDIKFAMLMGAFLGPQKAFMAYFLAVLVGTIVMVPGILIKQKTGKDQVPFGCFLTIATILTIFWGEKMIYYFLNWPMLMGF